VYTLAVQKQNLLSFASVQLKCSIYREKPQQNVQARHQLVNQIKTFSADTTFIVSWIHAVYNYNHWLAFNAFIYRAIQSWWFFQLIIYV